MKDVTIIGVDLAKNVFQLHGATGDGAMVFRKKVTRSQFSQFLKTVPTCLVVMEACGSAHYWAREVARIGHKVKLISPKYVKPFVKRQKNDAADAEAIVEAALRPTMRFVEPKTEEQQTRAAIFRIREKLVNQRTELVNAVRSHLYEFGYVAPQGIHHLHRLEAVLADEDTALPPVVRDVCRQLMEQIARLNTQVDEMQRRIEDLAKEAEISRRLQTMPGVGPVAALAVEAFAPPMDTFESGRAFAAWLGLVPTQKSSGGKQRLGKTSKMGQPDIRRLLIIGAMARVAGAARWGVQEGSWLARMMARKPRMLVAIALANKMARSIWAMLTKQQDYRNPVQVAAA